MSGYSDAAFTNTSNTLDVNQIRNEKMKNKIFEKMQPKPLGYLFDKNYRTILLLFFTLVIIDYKIFSNFYPMMVNIHSKHDYFKKQLQIEAENLNRFKQDLLRTQNDTLNHKKNNQTCVQCWFLDLMLNYNYIFNYVLEKNRHIKKSYNDTLYPLQHLLILMSFFNTILIMIIFKEPIEIFFISNLFTITCLCLYGEFFIEDKPNVYYTLIIGVGLVLFYFYIRIKIILTLFNIIVYQRMKNISTI
ncbi:unnamed protein product [Rotaria socialis]|uniref:Uncharacterized protein n=1 Tax=Rotaria socialis TaxID=392032 RepID=A0A821TY31_9BILA|nr:unnamed protein product [Rotaria socialis]